MTTTKSPKPAQTPKEPTQPTAATPSRSPVLSPAKSVQEHSSAPPPNEQRLAVVLRADNSYEYHVELARSVFLGILDPDVPDVFIEVPCPVQGVRRFLHTSYIKEIDVRGFF